MKNDWQIKKLGEICDLYQPKTISAKQMVADGKYLVFGANGIIGRYNQYNHEESQLLITCRGATCGTINISTPKSWITGNAMVVKPKDDSINVNFLSYILQGGVDIAKVITGAAQPQITRTNLAPLQIPLPPLPEQKRLVVLFDELFEKLEKAKENVEKNLKNSRELFEKYLDSIITNPKKDWKRLKLSDVITHVEYGSSKKSHQEGKVPVLGMGNIQNGRFEWNKLKYTNSEPEIKQYSLKYNDVLFNRTNSPELVGKTAIYKAEAPAIFAGYLIRIHRNENLLDGDYLNYYLNSNFAINYGRSVMISSVNQANINGSKLKHYPIVVPSLKEQQKIVAKLDGLSLQTKKIEAIYSKKLTHLSELKKSILHQAFSGKL